MRFRLRCFLSVLMVAFVLGPVALGVITALTPLKAFLSDSQFIAVVKVEKLLPEKPAMILTVAEELKGKTPFSRLRVNLTGDKEAEKEKHLPQLLKRLAPELSLVLFINKRGNVFTTLAYTNGTWFQILGRQTGEDTIAWSFTHCEPYLRRTFKGTTEELRRAIKDSLEKKKDPPPPDPKEPPGFGPEVKQSGARSTEREEWGAERGALLAVIPTLGVGGPLAILALLFPSVFGGTFVLLRQWLAFFTVISLVSLAYCGHRLLGDPTRGSWWGTDAGLWTVMLIITFLGTLWSWRRHLRFASDPNFEPAPARVELMVLAGMFLSCAVIFAICALDPPSRFDVLWSVFLAFAAGIGVALLYKAYRVLLCSVFSPPALPTEGVILWASLAAFVALPIARWGDGGAGGSAAAGEHGDIEPAQLVWQFQAPGSGIFVSSVLIEGDHLYSAAAHPTFQNGTLFCLNRHTGKEKWQFIGDGELKQVFSSPCIADGRLYIGEGFHDDPNCKLYCLDARTGDKLWEFQTTGQTESSPAVARGKVYFGAGNDGIYCLDAITGKKLWQFPGPDYKGRLLRIGAGPVVVGDRLYVGSGVDRNRKDSDMGETAVLCLDADTGTLLWKTPVDLPSWATPVVESDHLYCGISNGDIFTDDPRPAGAMLCLDPKTGKQIWRVDVPNGVLAQPAVSTTGLYFGARDGHCYRVSRGSGKVRWKVDVGSPVIASPVVVRSSHNGLAASVVFVSSGGKVVSLDPDLGSIQWCYSLEKHTPHLSSAPRAVVSPTRDGDYRRIYFAAGLDNVPAGRAVVFCLEDKLGFTAR